MAGLVWQPFEKMRMRAPRIAVSDLGTDAGSHSCADGHALWPSSASSIYIAYSGAFDPAADSWLDGWSYLDCVQVRNCTPGTRSPARSSPVRIAACTVLHAIGSVVRAVRHGGRRALPGNQHDAPDA